jgi:hypothetical protein
MRSRLISSLPALLFLVICFLATVLSVAAVIESGRMKHVVSQSGSEGWAHVVAARKTIPLTATLLAEDGNHGIGMRLLAFFGRFGDSSWSTGLHESRYAYDLIESVHVWTLCLFFGLTVIFDLRLLGWIMQRVPVSEVARRMQPWTVAGFVVMVISGALLFSAIPVRSYQSIFFRVKMFMLLLAGVNVWIFHSGVYRRVETWDLDKVPPRSARVAGALSLVLWVGVVLSGRMIAYNWFDCDRQPQPAIINFLTSCVPNGSER